MLGVTGTKFADKRVTLLTVDFAEKMHWRRNNFLRSAVERMGIHALTLPPDAVTIDEEVFDPARHFAAWREMDDHETAQLRQTAARILAELLVVTPAGAGRWAAVATELNAREVRTSRGGKWTAEGVRKAAGRIGTALEDTG